MPTNRNRLCAAPGLGASALLCLALACGGAALAQDPPAVPAPPAAAAPPDEGPALLVAPNVAALNAVNQALRDGDKEKALQLAADGMRRFPQDAQLRFVHAVILGDLGRVDEETAEFEAMCSQFPELPEPYNNLASIRAAQGRYADAEHLLQQALTAMPDYATARENLGDLYVAMAISSYEKAGKIDPSNTFVQKKLAIAREMSAKLRAARKR